MNGNGAERSERARLLMMAALDGEISSEERIELDRLLAEDATLREELERFGKVKEVTETMSYREPPEEIWEKYWVSVYNRFERGLGWILLCVGGVVALGFGAWKSVEAILADSTMPGYIKVAIFAAVLGGAILLFSVMREKLFLRWRDPYKEIKR